ncbi:MAG: hypothetical protein Kow0092_39880 [Deferrisomatales bacterium]
MTTVACEIFRRELEEVAPELAREATWVSPGLHVDLNRLHGALTEALAGADGVRCLFGACHPDLDELLAGCGGCRLPGKDCIAAFLDDGQRRALEDRKAFVMSPGWLRHWREIFQEALGWDEVDARQSFGLYDTIALLDFGLEPLDDMELLEFFEYTQTPIEVVPATLERFRRVLGEILDGPGELPGGPGRPDR